MTDSTKKAASIVFIDDDHGPIDKYQESLERAEFIVSRIRTAKDAFAEIEACVQRRVSSDLWLIDIMMPVGKEEILINGVPLRILTEYGLTCGLQIFRRLRTAFPTVPVILFTSITTPDILDSIELGEHTSCYSKLGVLPSELVRLVKQTLDRRKV